jgi:outer membrane autotransporter protein
MTGLAVIGDAGAAGTSVTVDGNGSSWSNDTNIFLGFLSASTLNLANGGTVTTSAMKIYSSSTFNLGTGGLAGTFVGASLVNDGRIVADFTDASTLGANISGSGSLAKAGAGTLTLSGTNTYSGGTTITAGRLVGNSASLPGDIVNNAQLEFNQAADGTSSGAISGSGSLIKTGTGTLILSGANTYSGSTTVDQGTLQAGSPAAFGASTVYTVNGGTLDLGVVPSLTMSSLSGTGGAVALHTAALTVDQSGDTSYDGAITGTGSLTKAGTGMLILNGVNTYTGGTTIDAGTLEVGDASHSAASIQGDVQVNAAGTLRGHGIVAGNVTNAGLVWPGGSIGTLTINGDYTQSPGGTLQMEVSPTQASQLKVGGTATLAGTLKLLYAPGTYSAKSYTLVSAGAINGKFSTVTGNTPSGLTQSVLYGLDTGSLDLTSSGSVVVAPTQATIFGALGSSALRAGQGVNAALLDRLAGPCGTNSPACPRQGNGLWIQAQGTDTRIDGNHGASDARDQRYGFLTGVDRQWKGWTVGVAGGYSHADVTESGNDSKGTLDTLRIAGYGAKNLGAYTLAGTLGYAYDFSSTTRSFGALGSAKGDGHGQEFTAGLQASRPWSLGPVVLTPRVGVRYAYLDGLGTDESGPTAQNLGVANQHLQSLQPYVGVTLDYPFTLRNNDRPASVQLRAGYAYETQDTGRNVSVTAADGTGFVIAGTRDTRGLVTAGLGAMLPIGKSASAYVRYDSVLHTGNVNAQSLQAGVDYRF